MEDIEYSPVIETLICIAEEVTVTLISRDKKDIELAEKVFKKKDKAAEPIQMFYQKYIDWANEFEEAWIESGEQYKGECVFFDAIANFTREKLEEYAKEEA